LKSENDKTHHYDDMAYLRQLNILRTNELKTNN